MENTKISWTNHTFNHVRGCTKISPGCTNCYAEKGGKRNPAVLGIWGPNGTRVVASETQWSLPKKWDRWAKEGTCHECGGRKGKWVEGESPIDGPKPPRVWLPCQMCGGTGQAEGGAYRARVFCASLADVFEDWQGLMVNSEGDDIRRCDPCDRTATQPVFVAEFSKGKTVDDCVCCGKPTRPMTMDDVRLRLFELIAATPRLDWMLLTKRPENIQPTLSRLPMRVDAWGVGGCTLWEMMTAHGCPIDNVWWGTTVENQAATSRIGHLLKIPGSVHFLSCEPLLEGLDLREHLRPHCPWGCGPVTDSLVCQECEWCGDDSHRINLAIVGGESGPGARPFDLQWARDLRDQCKAADCAYFFKQTGENVAGLRVRGKGGELDDIPADLRIREMPKAVPA